VIGVGAGGVPDRLRPGTPGTVSADLISAVISAVISALISAVSSEEPPAGGGPAGERPRSGVTEASGPAGAGDIHGDVLAGKVLSAEGERSAALSDARGSGSRSSWTVPASSGSGGSGFTIPPK
jgi:hypothetical protein